MRRERKHHVGAINMYSKREATKNNFFCEFFLKIFFSELHRLNFSSFLESRLFNMLIFNTTAINEAMLSESSWNIHLCHNTYHKN